MSGTFPTLHGSGKGYSGKQNITGTLSGGSEGNVAYGLFDYGLATSGNSLGLDFKLTEVDIVRGETLVLKGDGTLGVVVKDYQTGTSGGNLEIASGSNVVLSGQNEYTGTTTVRGHLAADASGLGDTSLLVVESSGTYVNAGENTVGGLRVVEDGTLVLDGDGEGQYPTLAIEHDADESSTISGVIQGSGNLSVNDGTLEVTANTGTNWQGNIELGTSTTNAVLNLIGENALGNGTVTFVNNDSEIHLSHSGALAFGNAVSGSGSIYVDLEGNDFTFANTQADLTSGSHLYLTNADFSLDAGQNAAVAGKTEIVLGSGSTLSSSGESDKNIWGLDLRSGGTVDFGQVDADGGQIVLTGNDGSSGRLDLSSAEEATVVFEGDEAEAGSRIDHTNTGSALLSGGGVFDLALFEGVKELYLDGKQISESEDPLSGLKTDDRFSGTGEDYYQHADEDGVYDLVAKLYRGGTGSFYYDGDAISMRYGIRQIDLQWTESGGGLRLAAGTSGGELSADVTGIGNIVFAGGSIVVSGGGNNDYTGSTYVENGANVELGKNNALGKTDYLSIVAGSTVTLGNGLSQTVGELVGDGTLNLGSGSTFTINNSQRQDGEDDPAAKDDILITTSVTASAGAEFVIDGAGAQNEERRADVSFATDASLTGADFTLKNAEIRFDHANATDLSYDSVYDAANFTLGTNSELVVDARNGNTAQNYTIDKTLTLSGGLISFSDVQFTTDAGDTAILEVGHIEVTDGGFIGVSATIDDNFNILDADEQHFEQTLIHYTSINGRDKLQAATSDQIDDSAIKNDSGNTVAYVEWDGGFVAEDQSPENTIVMSYKVAKLKLAQGGEENGLVLDANDHDTKLSVLIDDADEVKNNGGGNITFAGGDITVTHENTYTGVTKVTAGSVTLDANSAFGSSRLLAVENGTVNFSTVSQTLGSIDVGVSGNITGISGTGMVTLGSDAYADGISTISGQHSDFDTNLTLANGHTLTLNDTFGIGDTGTVVLGGDTKLVINDIDGGDLTKIVSGEAGANVRLSGSGFEISADNKNYRGNWTFTDGTTVSVAGDDNLSADDRLGSSGMVTLGNNASLALSQVKDNITIDNVFAGAGNLVVSGTNGQTFEFSRKWSHAEASGFTGTLRLNGDIQMTVGGKGDSSGANNAANLAYADFHLGADSKLIVEKQMSVVDTFDNLNVAQGSTVEFKGQLRTGAAPSNLGRLQVHTLTGTGNILLDIPTTDDTVVQEVAENYLLDLDTPQFETLITVESGAVSADGWTLNGESEGGSGFRQAVTNGTDTVAHAIYDYGLGVRNTDDDADADSLGVELDLTQVDIVKDQTLTFSTNGTLSAQVTNSSGAGNLSVTSGAEVTLSGKNNYSGNTNVVDNGSKLTAGESGLGNTNTLDLASGTAFVNAGLNTVKILTASDATIELNKTFTLASGVADRSTITGGSISGVGTLAIKNGWLTVSGELNDEKFSGIVDLGNVNPTVGYGGATLVLDGLAGIGHGTINFTTATSALDVNGSVGTTLTNLVSGAGEINVDLGVSTNVFDFRSDQGDAFKGWLILNNAGYHLYDDAGELASATLLTSGGGYVTVNTANYIADHKVGGLSLYGGTLDFGLLTEGSESGQIEVGADGFATNASPTVVKVALGENNNATGSDVFDLNSDLSVLLIEGFDATGRDLTSLDFSGSDEVDQLVKQSGRYADGSATAELTYSSGHLVGNESGISAAWDLSQINLLSGNGEGLLINASGESGGAGTISALITGDGNIEFAGGTVTLNNSQNSYSGSTTVSNETTLDLAQTGALGNTSDLKIESGTVAFNGTEQTIGSIHVDQTGEFTMSGSGSLTLTSGASVIASANESAFGGELIVQNDATLELRGSNAAGNLELAAVAQTSSISFTRVGSDTGYAEVDNLLTGSGAYIIGDGTNAAYVEFTNTANNFASVDVLKEGHFLINGMEDNSNNALGAAGLSLAGGAYAELNGSSGWTFDNVLDIDEGGELALSAGGSGNAFNFAGTNQRIDGTVTLTDLMLTIGGASGSGNAAVLDSASVVAGSNSHVHVALGNVADDRQQVKDFTLSSGAEITFDGQLGMSGVGANVLGQMDVSGTLTLDSGSTVHVSVDPNTGASSTVAQDRLVETAASGSFQNLITAGTIDGSAVSDDGTVTGIGLTDSSGNALQTVRADIKNGSDTVAVGTFGSSMLVSGSSFGVRYGLQAIDIVGDLTISESGSFSAKISSTSGTGSLTVSAGENLTLTGENDYTVATEVTGILTAEEKALGKTESLTISNVGQFFNAGANEVGELESSGKMTLNALLTVTNDQDGESHVSGTLTGNGGLMINSGSLVSTAVSEPTSGYTGTVTLGTSDTDAHLTLEAAAGAQIGSGTIEFANADSSLTINTSVASVLGNLLSGVGQVTVSGTNGESFAFKNGQQGEDVNFAGALTLTKVQYDFTTDANDILDDVSLTVNNGTTLVLNKADDTATRKINGMSLNGGRIDFGTIGNGSGHIDLQGQSLSTSTVADTTFSLETDLADRQDASGSAAFDGVIEESVLLIGNVAADTPESVLDGLAFEDNGQAFTRDLTQVTEKGTETTARIHGKLGGLVLTGNADGTKNVVAGLENQSLELLTTYNVRDSGSIALKIFGSGSLAVYDELTLTNGVNSYTGDTTVSGTGAVLTLGADGALGQTNSHTGKLSVTDGAKVDFGSTSQTIGSITAEGTDALVSANQTNGKLTIADGGTVSGVNSGFHTAVELSDGSADLTLTNVDALGQASITTLGSGTDLVLSGADGEFDNIVAGSGGVSIEDGANVTLKGDNTFDGSLKVDGSSSVAASGNVFSHIGDGSLELEGSADFTQTTFADEHPVWTWDRTVNGSGNLSLSTDGAHELVLESGFANFAGTLSLGDLSLSLSSGGRALQSLETFSGSAIKHLVLESGADLHLDGETTLTSQADAFDVTMKSGGSFVFEGIAVPGAEDAATNTTHLTVNGTLKLEKGFELSLSTQEGAKVDPTYGKSLLEQDDDGMTIDVIAANDIQGDVSLGKVTLDGGGDTKFEIVNAEGTTVADGYYGFDIVSGSSGRLDTISLEYKLDRVEIRGGEKLELKGDGDASLDSNTLKAEVTGSGDLSIAGNVTLDAANSYTGETIVTAGSKLYANENALGTVDGTLSAVTSKLRVEEGGEALINGFNTVEGLEIKKGGTLTIGSSSGVVPENPVMLTLKSDESAGSRLDGTLNGTGTIKVVGSGDVDDDNPADLTIVGSQGDFLGDLVLDSGAWIDLAANSLNIFGSSSSDASNRILVSKDS